MDLINKFHRWRSKIQSKNLLGQYYYLQLERNGRFVKNEQWLSIQGGQLVDLTQDSKLANTLTFFAKTTRLPNDLQVLLATYLATPINPVVLPRGDSDDDVRKAEYTQKLLRGIFFEQGWINGLKLVKAFNKWVVYGTLGVYVGYKRHGALMVDGEKKPAVKFTIDPLSPFEFMVDPTVGDNDDLVDCFIVRKVSKDWLKRKYGIDEDQSLTGVRKEEDETVVLEYFAIDSDTTENKHAFVTLSGQVFFEGKNPYGNTLPLVVVPYYDIADSLYGLSPVSLAIPVQNYINIMWSVVLSSMFLGMPVWQAPKGLIEDDEILPGKIVEYNPMIAGGKLETVKNDVISPSWITAIQLFMQEQQDKMHISEVNYGRARASDSGKKVALLAAQTEFVKIPQFIPFQHGLTHVAKKVLQDIRNDPYGYWTEKKIVEYVGGDNTIAVLPFKRNDISDGDIIAKYGTDLPVTKPQLMGQILNNALSRLAQNPSDEEAKRTLQHFYDMVGLGGLLSGNDMDRKKALRENNLFKEFGQKIKGMTADEIKAFLEENEHRIEVYQFQDHKTHLEVHQFFANSEEFEELPETIRQIVIEHINKHFELLGGAWSIPGSQINQAVQKMAQAQKQNQGGETNEMA